jgi:hypothetical protein
LKRNNLILKSITANLTIVWLFIKCNINRKEPAIVSIELDSQISINGLPVLVIWKAENYYKVEINGVIAKNTVVPVFTNSKEEYFPIKIKVYGYNNQITVNKTVLTQTYKGEKRFDYIVTGPKPSVSLPTISELKKPIESITISSGLLTNIIPSIRYRVPKFSVRAIIEPKAIPSTSLENGINKLN